MLALVAVLALPPSELILEVPLYVASVIDDDVLERAFIEADGIFAPGGVRFRFVRAPGESMARPAVTVVLQPRPARFVVHGCSRNRHDHRLGHTHLRGRRITLWSEQIARAVDGNWDRPDVAEIDDGVYARALGRVLAHELGHLFLRLDGHRDNGLMQGAFTHRNLTAKSSRAFRLSEEDLATIRASLERVSRASARH